MPLTLEGLRAGVYAVSGHGFDKTKAIYLQYRFTKIIEEKGHVEVVKGVNPQVLDLSGCDRAPLDQFVEHSDRLLFDAGCRVLRSPFASQRRTPLVGTEASSETDDNAPIEIGVISTPPLGSELELSYSGLWARGYPAQNGFIVMAGSELRSAVNPSAPPILSRAAPTSRRPTRSRPSRAFRIGSAAGRRLVPSRAIAAKVLCGSKDASTWICPLPAADRDHRHLGSGSCRSHEGAGAQAPAAGLLVEPERRCMRAYQIVTERFFVGIPRLAVLDGGWNAARLVRLLPPISCAAASFWCAAP